MLNNGSGGNAQPVSEETAFAIQPESQEILDIVYVLETSECWWRKGRTQVEHPFGLGACIGSVAVGCQLAA
jgi:hypothetical protein